jgi:hypothetical protein
MVVELEDGRICKNVHRILLSGTDLLIIYNLNPKVKLHPMEKISIYDLYCIREDKVNEIN